MRFPAMETITVTSGENDAATFTVNFAETIHMKDGDEIALKSIFIPPRYNVNKDTARIFYRRTIRGREIFEQFKCQADITKQVMN